MLDNAGDLYRPGTAPLPRMRPRSKEQRPAVWRATRPSPSFLRSAVAGCLGIPYQGSSRFREVHEWVTKSCLHRQRHDDGGRSPTPARFRGEAIRVDLLTVERVRQLVATPTESSPRTWCNSSARRSALRPRPAPGGAARIAPSASRAQPSSSPRAIPVLAAAGETGRCEDAEESEDAGAPEKTE
jgi:hypothetical protein